MPEIFTKISPMLLIFGVLLILPIKCQPHQLKALAFSLWLVGGCMLTYLGLIAGIIGLLIGFGKGRFVLSKTSTKNIERLNALSEPLPPRHVYSKRSWIVLSVMVLIALSLNTGLIPLAVYLRGAVNLAIGFALIISSLTYLSKGKAQAA